MPHPRHRLIPLLLSAVAQLRRSCATLLLVALVLSAQIGHAQSSTPQPPAQRPLIFVRSSYTQPAQVAAGELLELFVELHNVGDAGAVSIVVGFTSPNFVPEGSSSLKTVPSLQPNEHGMVSQKLRVAGGTTGGTYPVTITLSYQDDLGFIYESTEVVGVTVLSPTATPAAGRPQLVIESFTTEPPLPRPGEPFTLTLTLHNVGTGAARNVLLTNAAPSTFAPVGAGNVAAVGNVAWQATVQVRLRLVADQNAKAGLYTHPLTLDYDNAAGEHIQSPQNIALQLGEAVAKKEATAMPLVVIEAYRVEPEWLSPGQPFTLTLAVRNVGGATAGRVTIALGGSVTEPSKSAAIAPLGTGNVRYLAALEPEGAAEVTARFIVDGAAPAGVYVMTVQMDYTGPEDKALARSEQISLVVRTQPQLEMTFYQPVGQPPAGQPFPLPVEIFNVGRSRLNSTNAEFVGQELQILKQPGYIGPLDPGTSVTADGQATADTPGPKRLLVRVYYVDDFNQPQVYEQELTVEVGEGVGPSGTPGASGGVSGKPGAAGSASPGQAEGPQRPFVIRLLRGLLGLGSA